MRLATPLLLAALASGGIAQTTTRVSVSSAGVEANGPTTAVTISESGRWVAMQSAATNLVAGDTNGVDDIFLHDRNWATTTRASVATGGAGANGSCALPSISGNGQRVAFESTATNLASGYGPVSQVYVHDRVAGTTVAASPVAGNGASSECAISLDGNWVVFHSSATNLVAGDTNGAADVFLCDLAGGTITRVSVSSGGIAGNGPSTKASVSADGRYVTFVSSATNLVAGDVNGVEDVFLRDTQCAPGRASARHGVVSRPAELPGDLHRGVPAQAGSHVGQAAVEMVMGATSDARDQQQYKQKCHCPFSHAHRPLFRRETT